MIFDNAVQYNTSSSLIYVRIFENDIECFIDKDPNAMVNGGGQLVY